MRKKILLILLAYIPVGLIVISVLMVTVLRWCPVPGTPLMLKRSIQNSENKSYRTQYQWIPGDKISPKLKAAVIASEDQRYFEHGGFDFEELRKMRHQYVFKGKRIRGCSTISQQAAKNCFTWCTHSYCRKIVEAYFTVLIEIIWGKEKILEVYLNVAEFGPGIYGAEAASRTYFKIPASDLSVTQAATLACCLPNPLKRNPSWVSRHMVRRRDYIARISVESAFYRK